MKSEFPQQSLRERLWLSESRKFEDLAVKLPFPARRRAEYRGLARWPHALYYGRDR